ncbi:MAG: hypothetical protein AAB649_00295 [Patescibacteria group bacterium]
MANGTIVLVKGKALGTIVKWDVARGAYLVELADSGVCQYIAEKYLTI